MKKILIISHDKVGPSMAGPGIRYHQIATELSNYFDVTLATFNPEYTDGLKNVNYTVTDIKTYSYQNDFLKYDVIFALWLSTDMINFAKDKGIILVFDLYAPVPVEDLIGKVYSGKTSKTDSYDYGVLLNNYRDILKSGDYFVCSNGVQKDFWTGYGFSANASYPSNYTEFPLFDRIQLLPMGIDLNELSKPHNTQRLFDELEHVSKTDFILLWTGGIWDWFDALTPIKAIDRIVKSGVTDVKLVFLGTKHPNKDVPEMSETRLAYDLADKLGLRNKYVFFLEGWVKYDDRLDYLLSADAAIYAHKPSIEARYSHRTRVLDHILSGLPTIATQGDYLGSIIKKENLGLMVEPLDEIMMSNSILELKQNNKKMGQIQKSINKIKNDFTWQKSCEELVRYLSEDIQPRFTSSIPSIGKSQSKKWSKLKKITPPSVKRRIKKHIL